MDTLYWLWLRDIEKLSATKKQKLLEKFESPQAIYQADAAELLVVENITLSDAQNIVGNKNLDSAKNQKKQLAEKGIAIVTPDQRGYPSPLQNIHHYPLVLYHRGEYEMNDEDIYISMVGSRNATQYGVRSAKEIAYQLAKRGIVIVSGMAYGIDAAAHQGALEAGGKTVAVLGCGIDVVYPRSNEGLYQQIMKNGCVVSEYGLGVPPAVYTFPARNRIISGLSAGTVIVEAAAKSGALITAKLALEQNREVFAVPGSIMSPTSDGTNALIKNTAAKLVTSYEDILEEILPAYTKKKTEKPPVEDKRQKPQLSGEEEKIYQLILKGCTEIDELALHANLSTSAVSSMLTMMEIDGLIYKDKGSFFIS